MRVSFGLLDTCTSVVSDRLGVKQQSSGGAKPKVHTASLGRGRWLACVVCPFWSCRLDSDCLHLILTLGIGDPHIFFVAVRVVVGLNHCHNYARKTTKPRSRGMLVTTGPQRRQGPRSHCVPRRHRSPTQEPSTLPLFRPGIPYFHSAVQWIMLCLRGTYHFTLPPV